MVDVVLHFEGDKYKTYRILRSIKNRFGCTNEIGIFNMVETGLTEISNPSEIFLRERSEAITPGSTIIISNEGSRVLTAEVQALVGTTAYPSPRRVANGIDYNRLLQILAVIEKRIGLKFSTSDVYVNITGGIEIDEPAADLGVALAIITCARDVVVSPDTSIVGEIGLSGEIRKVNNIEKRISEAQKLGFKKIIIPKGNLIKRISLILKLLRQNVLLRHLRLVFIKNRAGWISSFIPFIFWRHIIYFNIYCCKLSAWNISISSLP